MRASKYFFVVVFVLSVFISEAQPIHLEKKQQDSLWLRWQDAKLPDSSRLQSIDKLIYSFILVSKDSSLKLIEIEQAYASKHGDKKYLANSYFLQAFFALGDGEFGRSEQLYKKALQNYEAISFYKGVAASYNGIGNTYLRRGDYVNGIDNYVKASKTYLKAGNKMGYALTVGNIGSIFYEINDYPQAYNYYLESSRVFLELDKKEDLAKSYNNIGTCIKEFDDTTAIRFKIKPKDVLDSALAYYTRSLEITKEIGNTVVMTSSYNNVGIINMFKGNYDAALVSINKGLELAIENEDQVSITSSYSFLANVYNKQLNFKNAIEYGNKALALAREYELVDLQLSTSENLYKSYKAVGNKEMALLNLETYLLLKDSVSKEDSNREIVKKMFQFEFDKKEALAKAENEKQRIIAENEKKQQRLILISVVIGALFLLGFSVFIFRSLRKTREQKRIIEEQKVLVDEAYEHLHEKNKEVMDSIYYARRIQRALITPEKYIEKHLKKLMKKD